MNSNNALQFSYLSTSLGILEIAAQEAQLTHILFVDEITHEDADEPVLREAKKQLQAYFSGALKHFDLPLAPQGTAFQKRVWQALLSLDYGQTCSYADIAQKLGDIKAVRAVGAANGKNPLSIVVPCHRVIGKDGKLTGYAGGLSRKAWLLNLESGQNNPSQSSLF